MNFTFQIDTFLYRHFKHSGQSPNKGLVQPVEKYGENSSVRLKL